MVQLVGEVLLPFLVRASCQGCHLPGRAEWDNSTLSKDLFERIPCGHTKGGEQELQLGAIICDRAIDRKRISCQFHLRPLSGY